MPSKTTRVLSKDKMVASKDVCQGYRFFFTFVGATAMGGRRERMREGGTYDKYDRKFAFTHASYMYVKTGLVHVVVGALDEKL